MFFICVEPKSFIFLPYCGSDSLTKHYILITCDLSTQNKGNI